MPAVPRVKAVCRGLRLGYAGAASRRDPMAHPKALKTRCSRWARLGQAIERWRATGGIEASGTRWALA